MAAILPEPKQQQWSGLFEDVEEIDTSITDIEGTVPEALAGTLFCNGPGKRRFSKSFFDGDGMIRALRLLPDGSVQFQSRFVETPKFLKEKHSNKPKVRTAGTNLPGGLFRNMFKLPADEANTHVFPFKGELLASEEGGHPWRIARDKLETLGEEHFEGALPRRVAFSAHPHYDKQHNEIYNFGMKPGKTMAFQCFKIDRNKKLHMLADFSCDKGSFAHDYALTGKWMVFMIPPLAGNMLKFLSGVAPLFDTMRWHEQWGTDVVLVPRDGGKPQRIQADSFSIGHVLSAWDQADEILIDVTTSDNSEFIECVQNYRESDWHAFAGGTISRIRINTKTSKLTRETLCSVPGDFPRIHPERECIESRWAYLASNTREKEGGLFHAIMKLDRESGEHQLFDFGADAVVFEPVFVPKPGSTKEDDGWLISHVYDVSRAKSSFAILDARNIADGPLARIHLGINIGTTFHGSWVSNTHPAGNH